MFTEAEIEFLTMLVEDARRESWEQVASHSDDVEMKAQTIERTDAILRKLKNGED